MMYNKKTKHFTNRLYHAYNLLFFFILMLPACNETQSPGIQVLWNRKQAVSVRIPTTILPASADSIPRFLQVRAAGDTTATAIMGTYLVGKDILFEPLIPFSHGMQYEIFFKTKKLGVFSIPLTDTTDLPKLTEIYPGVDTVPENLLKIYLQFSHPMQEGRSAGFIRLVRNTTDTLQNVFLDLQPELWNEDRTVLTIWLDPGRIKRALQPNLRLGIPIHEKENYRLVISRRWKDAQGIPLQKDYIHSFVAGSRDSLGPDPSKWIIQVITVAPKQVIEIDLTKPLDHFLVAECLHISDPKGTPVKGNFEITRKDDRCRFFPEKPLRPGTYTLRVETKLEDLAGNNINRPFDRDINHSKQPSTNTGYTRYFKIN